MGACQVAGVVGLVATMPPATTTYCHYVAGACWDLPGGKCAS